MDSPLIAPGFQEQHEGLFHAVNGCLSAVEFHSRASLQKSFGVGGEIPVDIRNKVAYKEGMKTPEIRIDKRPLPQALLEALGRVNGKYSSIEHVFHAIELWTDDWIGVAGDGNNGGYEHFRWKDGKLTITDCGYGITEIALRDALNAAEPPVSSSELVEVLERAEEYFPKTAIDAKSSDQWEISKAIAKAIKTLKEARL